MESIQRYIDSADLQEQLYRRTLRVVLISQIFGGAGLAAGVTVGALLAQDMLGTDSYAGVPAALITLGSASAAWWVGRLSQRRGRRIGLVAGLVAGGLGAFGVVAAAAASSLTLLFLSLLLYGGGTATNLQARYAGADMAKPSQRAKGASAAMVSTTFGAVAGPNLVGPMGRFAESLGIPALAGPFLLAGTAFLLAGLVFYVCLRPDPLLVSKAIAEANRSRNKEGGIAASNQADDNRAVRLTDRGILVGASVMVLTQIVMIAIMTMTPVHMKHHGHGLEEVGLVISIHIAAMFLPSLVTGALVDKIGRMAMSIVSGIILLAAAVLAAAAPADSMPLLIAALALLGLGWNFGLISGTAMIVDATHPGNRARTQGNLDVLIALAGASGGALSGMVAAHTSFAALSLCGGILSLLLIPVVLWSRSRTETTDPAASSSIRG